MCSNTWLRSGSREECVTANIKPPRSKTKKTLLPNKLSKKTLPPNKSAKKGHITEATTSNSQTKAPRKNPQWVTRTLWLGIKGRAQTTRLLLIQNKRRKQVILKYTLWQRPTFRTSSLQSLTPTGARSQPKWGPAEAHCRVVTEPVKMTHPVVTLNQVPMRKAWSTKILISVIAQQGVHCTSIALYNLCVQHA